MLRSPVALGQPQRHVGRDEQRLGILAVSRSEGQPAQAERAAFGSASSRRSASGSGSSAEHECGELVAAQSARTSLSRSAACMRPPPSTSMRSPVAWPRRLLTAPKSSRSMAISAAGRSSSPAPGDGRPGRGTRSGRAVPSASRAPHRDGPVEQSRRLARDAPGRQQQRDRSEREPGALGLSPAARDQRRAERGDASTMTGRPDRRARLGPAHRSRPPPARGGSRVHVTLVQPRCRDHRDAGEGLLHREAALRRAATPPPR